MMPVEIYDPARFRNALELDEPEYDDGYVGPPEDRPIPRSVARNTEGEIWARCLQKILDDPRGHTRPPLVGNAIMAERLVAATATMDHFASVTGIIERAIIQSARTERPVRFPPILMVSPPGVGKTFYCRAVAQRLRRRAYRLPSTARATGAVSVAFRKSGAAPSSAGSPGAC